MASEKSSAEPQRAVSPLVPFSRTELVSTFRVDGLIRDWQEVFDIDVSGELNGIEEISLHRCETSRLHFFMPHASAGSDHLYRSLQKFDWFYLSEKWEFDAAIKDLGACKKVLEVGAGPGFFIKHVREKLKNCVIKGIELSESVVEIASREALPIEQIDMRQLLSRGESFDAICSFQVLEHSARPRELVDAMVRALQPGGKLIISVPNRESFLKYQYNLLDMPPHHMTRWNAFSLRYLEKLFPIKVVRIDFEPLSRRHTSGYVTAYAGRIKGILPLANRVFSQSRMLKVSVILERSGLHRFLRGQGIYVLFERL